jgi:hypothetical protein
MLNKFDSTKYLYQEDEEEEEEEEEGDVEEDRLRLIALSESHQCHVITCSNPVEIIANFQLCWFHFTTL